MVVVGRWQISSLRQELKCRNNIKVTKSDQIWGFGKNKNPVSIENQLLTGFCRTQKTICFRTALWKTWDEYIVSESTFHHSMMSDFENFPHLGKGKVLMFFVISHPPYLPIIVEVACGKRLYKYHRISRRDNLTPVCYDDFTCDQ